MSKIKKVRKIPPKVKEIKKKEDESKKELENKIEIERLENNFKFSKSTQVSPTLKKKENLETISTRTIIKTEKKEISEGERTNLYDENSNNLYDSNSSKDSSKKGEYESPNSQEIIGRKNEGFGNADSTNLQLDRNIHAQNLRVPEEKRGISEDNLRRDYDSQKDNKRKYLM